MTRQALNAIAFADNALNALDLCRGKSAWVVTDGKTGDIAPCLGLTQALNLVTENRIIRPRRFFAALAPFGPIDPKERSTASDSPIAPPFPDFVFASGRRAVPYLRHVRRKAPNVFTVFLRDPRISASLAHVLWVPEHDFLRGDNVIVTTTSPHIVQQQALKDARNAPDKRLAHLPEPRLALVLGGDSRHHKITEKDCVNILAIANMALAQGYSLMITPSRRTPKNLVAALAARLNRDEAHAFLWDGQGDNPYLSMLALANGIVVTADSVNMIGEALATRAPVMVYEPCGGHRKITAMLDNLEQKGALARWRGAILTDARAPLDSTPVIAKRIAAFYAQWRQTNH